MELVNQSRGKADSRLVPVWFQLSSRFYRRLAEIAEECELTQAEVIKKGATLVLLDHRGQIRKASDEKRDEAAVELGKLRWRDISSDERQKMARELSQKRWAKQRRRG